MSTLVEQFVLSRLSTLFNDDTVEPSLYHFTREECNIEMYLAGQVSGIFYFDSNANPPAFKYLHKQQIFFGKGLAMVQTFLCPWWTLPFLNRLMDIQKPGYTLYPYLAGLDSQYKASKVINKYYLCKK
jgi:hypothetical protein